MTTKVGLCRNLRNLIWFDNIDIDTISPRAYDLTDISHLEDFIEDFKLSKAESILKAFAIKKEFTKGFQIEEEFILKTAMSICSRR